MTKTDLHLLQPATVAVAARPETTIGYGTTGCWLATSRLSMTVPAFHDRRPLCSTT